MNPKFFRNGIVMLVLVVGTAALLFTWIQSSSQPNPIGYSQFLNDVQQGHVQSVVQQGDTLTVKRNDGSRLVHRHRPQRPDDRLPERHAGGRQGRQRRPSPPTSTRPSRRPTRRGSACS